MRRLFGWLCATLGLGLQAGFAQDGIGMRMDSPVGWASMDALGQNGTTGGAGGKVVTAHSGGELAGYAGKPEPMIIRVSGEFSIGTISVNSNKTIEGAAPGARVRGTLGINRKQNIIIRNLVVRNEGGGSDGIPIVGSHHIWIDHCDLSNSSDEIISMTYGCDFITVSWTRIWYSYNDKGHRYSVLMSNSDGAGGDDAGKLNVTFHHNWWADNVQQRMPRFRFGKVHVFNNYYSAVGNDYCVGTGRDGKSVVENNYFDNVKDPHVFFNDDPSAQVLARGNVYRGISATTRRDSGQGPSFAPPYDYPLDPGERVKEIVMAGAGPFNTPKVATAIHSFPTWRGRKPSVSNTHKRGYDATGRLRSAPVSPVGAGIPAGRRSEFQRGKAKCR